MGYSLAAISFAVLVMVGLVALQAYLDHLAWENRPTFEERVIAPYNLEGHLPPYLLEAVQVDGEVETTVEFITANISRYRSDERPPSVNQLGQVVKIQSIVPARIGDFTLLWDRTQPTLLAQCLLQTGASEQRFCQTPFLAEFMEAANFVDSEGKTVSLVMAKFPTDKESEPVFESVYQYARSIGRIGNFAFVNSLDIDYFYSFTRSSSSFTWLNNNWVLSVSANAIATVDKFMDEFPLYEDNPNLNQYVVMQIDRNSGLNLLEPTPEPTLDPATAISGTVSGTEGEATGESSGG